MVDGYGGDPGRLDDDALLKRCLFDLSEAMGMRPLAPPQIVSAPDNMLRDPGGWSGVLIIAESHISLHTFPRRRFVSADVYTCRNGMDCDVAAQLLRSTFLLADTEVQFVRRGLRYPARNLL